MDFVACWYNFHWCVGLILWVNEPQLEDNVKFICPQPHMAHHYHFVSLSKMTFALFLRNKLFAQLTLLLHPVDESTNFQDLSLKTIEQTLKTIEQLSLISFKLYCLHRCKSIAQSIQKY